MLGCITRWLPPAGLGVYLVARPCVSYLAGVATFYPLNSHRIKRSRTLEQSDQAIKSLGTERSSDQKPWNGAIKDDLRFLISVANVSTGEEYVTTPCTSVSIVGKIRGKTSSVCTW